MPRVGSTAPAHGRRNPATVAPFVTPTAVHRTVDSLGSTAPVHAKYSPISDRSPGTARSFNPPPQAAHRPSIPLACTDPALSPICTAPTTDTCIYPSISSRRRPLGKVVVHRSDRPGPACVSALSFSFQVGAESSTVVHRQPLRWSQCAQVAQRVTPPKPLVTAFIGVCIEGTL